MISEEHENWTPASDLEYIQRDDGLVLQHGENTAKLYVREMSLEISNPEKKVFAVILDYHGVFDTDKKVVGVDLAKTEAEEILRDLADHKFSTWRDIEEEFKE